MRRAKLEGNKEDMTTAEGLLEGGCDCFILETFQDLNEILAALRAIRRVTLDVPVIAQMTFGDDGKTLYGVTQNGGSTGRGSIGLPTDASSPAPKITSRPLPPCCWCSANSGTAPTPRAGRTSDTHDSADKTPEESLLPCSAAHPTVLFRSVC